MIKAFTSIAKDFKVIFERDPAARGIFGWLEVLLTYAGFHALMSHRICHAVHTWRIPIIPRFLSQITRFLTGIEIHPGATIGNGFFIDHGMGVVIGETTEIGNNVTIFQGVTLGGTGKEAGKRHPTIGDNVVIGAGAKILGSITVGKNVKVGAGSVIVRSIPDNCTVVGVPGMIVRREGKKPTEINLDHGDLPNPIRQRLLLLQKEIDCILEHIQCAKEDCEIHKLAEKLNRGEDT